jgi:hypothetical protein
VSPSGSFHFFNELACHTSYQQTPRVAPLGVSRFWCFSRIFASLALPLALSGSGESIRGASASPGFRGCVQMYKLALFSRGLYPRFSGKNEFANTL